MREFEGKVAVVTGAASGMGRAFAGRFASEGMSVVLADIEEEALKTAVTELEQQERRVIGVVTDTTSKESVQALADRAFNEFGGVNILCNNAGVASTNDSASGGEIAIWEVSDGDWQWVVGVNFWGVVHGIQAFVPRMVESGEEGHIVNTASVAAITPTGGVYGATKHAVLALTEGLYQDLRDRNSKVSASVLCPGFVRTSIARSERNRPEGLGGGAVNSETAEQLNAMNERGKDPEEIAEQVFEAVRDDRFYILPHPAWDMAVRQRTERILARGAPYELDFMDLIRNMPPGEKL